VSARKCGATIIELTACGISSHTLPVSRSDGRQADVGILRVTGPGWHIFKDKNIIMYYIEFVGTKHYRRPAPYSSCPGVKDGLQRRVRLKRCRRGRLIIRTDCTLARVGSRVPELEQPTIFSDGTVTPQCFPLTHREAFP
jgi:hypothetical protein